MYIYSPHYTDNAFTHLVCHILDIIKKIGFVIAESKLNKVKVRLG